MMNELTIRTTRGSRQEGAIMAIENNSKRLGVAVIAAIGLIGGAVAVHAATFSQRVLSSAAPAAFPAIAPTCTATCAITLDAGTGSVTIADAVNGPQTVPFYGFNVNGEGTGAHTLAGGTTSTIKVPRGTTLTITLTQDPSITDPIDLSFPSLPAGDVSHVGAVYTVVASKVGTSVFQPGSNADAPKQVAMGLVGILIVTPTGCAGPNMTCAYNGTVSYSDEALVATTDLDFQFATKSADFPGMSYFAQSRMPDGSPRKVYHVLNGKSFPDTDVIDVRAGDSVLLRSVNAGVTDKSMSLLGLHQTLLARNAAQYTDPQTFTSPLVGPGETADLSVEIPTNAAAQQRYALIDAGRQMNHGNQYGFGGALTFLNVWPPAPVLVPPVVVPPVVVPPVFAVLPPVVAPPVQEYVPLTPARLADTRVGTTTTDGLFAGGGIRSGGSTLELTVAGRGGVAAAATAVALNVTVAGPLGSGFVTVYPCGAAQPMASNLNYTTGGIVPNAVIAKVGAGGNVCIFVSATTDLIVDVSGYFPTESSFRSINPARVLETRPGLTTIDGLQQGDGARAAGSVTAVQIGGRASVSSDPSAVVLNVTVTAARAAGYVTVYPCGTAVPMASNINYVTGSTVANLVVAKVGSGGAVCVFTSSGVDLIADVNGYFPAVTSYQPLDPARLLETRSGLSTVDGRFNGAGLRPANSITELSVSGRGGVAVGAATVVLNVTVTEPIAPGFVTVYPCGIAPPLASNLNYRSGATVANAVIVKVGSGGKVCLLNTGPTQLVVDVNGYLPT